MPVNPLYFTEGQLDITVKSTDRAGNVNQKSIPFGSIRISVYLPASLMTINHHRKRTGGVIAPLLP